MIPALLKTNLFFEDEKMTRLEDILALVYLMMKFPEFGNYQSDVSDRQWNRDTLNAISAEEMARLEIYDLVRDAQERVRQCTNCSISLFRWDEYHREIRNLLDRTTSFATIVRR